MDHGETGGLMAEREFTLDEANALLPYLAPALVELREKVEEAVRLGGAMEASSAAGGGIADQKAEQARVAERADELMGRVLEFGVLLRDPSTGLVDFPARHAGRDILFCWRLGETEVLHWHSPEDGFLGRRSIAEL